jgi:GT2 family glycosyltransferase
MASAVFSTPPEMPMIEPDLFVAVVAHNPGSELVKCIASVDFVPPDRIVVVDCASNDGSIETVPKGSAKIISAKSNLGYAGGNNLAVRSIAKAGGKVALILNPDARIDPKDLERLLDAFKRDRKIGAAFPVVRSPDPNGPVLAYGQLNYRHRLVRMVGKEALPGLNANPVDVDFGLGCAFVVLVEAFEKIGGFDEDFFAYHDEPDLCLRMRKAGFRTVLVPGAKALHESVESDPARLRVKEYLVARNSVLFMKKHGTTSTWTKFSAFLFVGTIWCGFRALLGNRRFWRRMQGIYDGLTERPPRPSVLAER